MMKLAVLAALAGSAAAFAPAQTGRVSTAVSETKADLEVLAKKLNPVVGFYDPLNLAEAEFWGTSNEATIGFLRHSEIKHGRIAMLGVVGYLTTYAGVRLPGLEDVPCGWAAVTSGDLPFEVAGQFFATTIMMEMFNRDNAGTGQFPGDYRNGYIDFGWDKQSDAWKKNKRTIELNQGRAAQMGLLGLMFHDALGNVADILP
mmetsp:Transcript_25952/g.39919  ORF Transcript_25952/g.39919 Transcript_25952/m.39919 type:complete len:202 (+) Transcript_25952:78-683(+)